jgi:O-antigen/teichoic acid export membrane protein
MILLLSALFFGEKIFITPSLIQFLTNIIYAGFCLIVFKSEMTEYPVSSIILAYYGLFFIQGLLLVGIYYFKYKNRLSGFFINHQAVIRTILSYSKIAFLANLLFVIYNRSDYWMIKVYGIKDSDLGNYVQASRLVQLFQLIPSILAGVIFPVGASNKERMMNFIMPIGRSLLILNLIAAGLIFLTGDALFPFILGDTFNLMYHFFLLLIPGMLSFSIFSLISAYFAAIDKVRWNLFTTFIAVICMLGGNLFFIEKYGIDASAISSSGGVLIACIVSIIFFKKETGFNWKQILFPGKNDRQFYRSIFRFFLKG